MIVKKVDTQRTCGVCDRTLLLGERATRYSAGGPDWVVSLFRDVSSLVGRLLEDRLNMLAQAGFSGTFAACPSEMFVEDDAELRLTYPASSYVRGHIGGGVIIGGSIGVASEGAR